MSETERCPVCEVELPAEDLQAQSDHMLRLHPDVVAKRRGDAARWDGWVND